MFTKITNTLTTNAVFSEDGNHRYLLTKSWDTNQKTCTIITKFPANEGTLYLDLTTFLTLNQLSKLGYGTIHMVNLYSNIKSPHNKKHLDDGYDKHTDIHIMDAAKESDTIIIAYGSYGKNPKVIPRAEEVMKMLKPHQKKIKHLINPTNSEDIHPLNPIARHEWVLK